MDWDWAQFKSWRRKTQGVLRQVQTHWFWRYALALAFTAGALFLRMALDPMLHNNYAFPTFFLAVILTNWLCGAGPTLLTIAFGLVLTDWFFIPPRYELFRYKLEQWIGLITYLVVSLALVWYVVANRRAQARLDAEVRQRRETEEKLRAATESLASYNERLERTVQERTASLEESVAELHHFSYALAHDMRAPLRATEGYLTLIERQAGASLSPQSLEMLRRVKLATQHLDVMIVDALNYNKAVLQELPLEPVELRSLLSGLAATYPNLQPERADIELATSFPPVLGHRAALIQCFANLLDNAVKFAKPGVKPRVVIWAEERSGPPEHGAGRVEEPPPSPRAEPESRLLPSCPAPRGPPPVSPPAGRCVRVWVEDNGIGLPEDYQQRLFGMFQRFHAGYEGTGIGLAIVRKVVQRMGGEVGAESEEGRGSRFWVELQRA